MRAEQARAMARYNQWMNEKLYAAAGRLDDAGRRRDRGAFFGSIHGTMNHLLVGDHIWMDRFAGRAPRITALDQELHHGFDALRAARVAFDGEIVDFADGLDEDRLAAPFAFTSTTRPVRWRGPMWLIVAHFFNHQTHHRGQLSTLLAQAGEDIGVTDLLYLPGGLERLD